MIKKAFFSLAIILTMAIVVNAQEHTKKHVIDLRPEAAIGNMSQVISLHGYIYMTGQPDQETLNNLKDSGFDAVINIRGADEINFDEAAMVQETGLSYYNIPLMKAGKIQDAAVTEIHMALKENKGRKILLHCSSGNRVAGWLGALMVRDLGYETEVAITRAKQAGMTKDSMEKILRDYLATLPQ